jgi:hypothetical protein
MSAKNLTSDHVTLHADGTVTLWDVFTQSWDRRTRSVSHEVLASLTAAEREAIIAHIAERVAREEEARDACGYYTA